MSFPVCQWMESKYRDATPQNFSEYFSEEVRHSARVHLINAFGYREEWAQDLLSFIKWDAKSQPYFGINPETPEAHRHKFLTTLTLSKNSPGQWKLGDKQILAKDFLPAILEGDFLNWVDDSDAPDPSWTLQYLSAFLDPLGKWNGKQTLFAEITERSFVSYLEDYKSQKVFQNGKTVFVESGLHLLEAINKILAAQAEMIVEAKTKAKLKQFYPLFKNHFIQRLFDAVGESMILLSETDIMEEWIGSTISNTLVLGHLCEVAVHPQGILLKNWDSEEKKNLKIAMEKLSQIMEIFWKPEALSMMQAEQQKAYHFPLFHAYHALKLFEKIDAN